MAVTFNPFTSNFDIVRPPTIGAPVLSGTAGSILFVDPSGNLGQDNTNLFWDTDDQRMYVNFSAHNVTAALTLMPKVTTDDTLVLYNIASQTGEALSLKDSTGTDIFNITRQAVLTPLSLATWEQYNDGRVFTSTLAGRGSFNVTPALAWSAIPTGILPKSAAQFGISDRRSVLSSINDGDNVFAMEFNPSRSTLYTDVGVTAATANAGLRSFFAISGQASDQAGQAQGGAAGYLPINNPTVNRNMNLTMGVFKLSYSHTYFVNTNASFVYDSAVLNSTVSGSPSFSGSGTFRQNDYIVKGTLTGNTVGSNTVGIGVYLNVSGYNTNYGFVHEGAGSNFMGLNNSKTLFGGTDFVIATGNTAHSITGNYASISYTGTHFLFEHELVTAGAASKFNSLLGDVDFEVYGNTQILMHLDANAGLSYIRPDADSVTAFAIQDAAGNNDMLYDSTNNTFVFTGALTAATLDTGNGAVELYQSSTYAPTRSAEANLDANVTFASVKYERVGNQVTVAGRFTADPTLTATATSFEMTLPIASNLGAAGDVSGVAFCGSIAGMGAEIIGSVANDTAVVQWVSSDITAQTWSFVFSYRVI